MDLIIDKAWYPDWEFIRELRNSQKQGFINQNEISEQEHYEFMEKNGEHYYIVYSYINNGKDFLNKGFIGVVNDDIRFCVDSKFQNQGIGTFMLEFIKNKYPKAIGKVKKDNQSSIKAFQKAEYIQIKDKLFSEYYFFTTQDNSFNCSECKENILKEEIEDDILICKDCMLSYKYMMDGDE